MRAIFVSIACLAIASCAPTSGPRDFYDRLLTPLAHPTEVIAADLAFARAAQEDGQWSAFRDFAADDAMLFMPGPVKAEQWLDGREDPAQAASWEPHHVWSSCDGSLAVTSGGYTQPDGAHGAYITVWKRQGTDRYRWVLDQAIPLERQLTAPEFIGSTVADCGTDGAQSATDNTLAARDGTLSYAWTTAADGAGSIVSILMLQDGKMRRVLTSETAAQRP